MKKISRNIKLEISIHSERKFQYTQYIDNFKIEISCYFKVLIQNLFLNFSLKTSTRFVYFVSI